MLDKNLPILNFPLVLYNLFQKSIAYSYRVIRSALNHSEFNQCTISYVPYIYELVNNFQQGDYAYVKAMDSILSVIASKPNIHLIEEYDSRKCNIFEDVKYPMSFSVFEKIVVRFFKTHQSTKVFVSVLRYIMKFYNRHYAYTGYRALYLLFHVYQKWLSELQPCLFLTFVQYIDAILYSVTSDWYTQRESYFVEDAKIWPQIKDAICVRPQVNEYRQDLFSLQFFTLYYKYYLVPTKNQHAIIKYYKDKGRYIQELLNFVFHFKDDYFILKNLNLFGTSFQVFNRYLMSIVHNNLNYPWTSFYNIPENYLKSIPLMFFHVLNQLKVPLTEKQYNINSMFGILLFKYGFILNNNYKNLDEICNNLYKSNENGIMLRDAIRLKKRQLQRLISKKKSKSIIRLCKNEMYEMYENMYENVELKKLREHISLVCNMISDVIYFYNDKEFMNYLIEILYKNIGIVQEQEKYILSIFFTNETLQYLSFGDVLKYHISYSLKSDNEDVHEYLNKMFY